MSSITPGLPVTSTGVSLNADDFATGFMKPVSASNSASISKPEKVNSNLIGRIKNVLDKVKEFWGILVKEPVKIASTVLKVLSLALTKVAESVKTAIQALGLISFGTALLHLVGIPFSIKGMVDKAKIDDKEAAAFSGSDAVMGAVETIGDTGSGVSALAALGAIPIVVAFAVIALPFAIAGLGYAVGKGVYNLAHNAKFLHDIRMIEQQATAYKVNVINAYTLDSKYENKEPNLLSANRIESTAAKYKFNLLKNYIDGKLNATDEEVEVEVQKEINKEIKKNEKELFSDKLTIDHAKIEKDVRAKLALKKQSIFERRSDKKMVELMKHFRKNVTSRDDVQTQAALDHIKGFMWRKIGLSSAGIAVNAALLGGLIATLITPVAPLAMLIIGGVKAVVGIGKSVLNMRLETWHDKWYADHKERFAAAAA